MSKEGEEVRGVQPQQVDPKDLDLHETGNNNSEPCSIATNTTHPPIAMSTGGRARRKEERKSRREARQKKKEDDEEKQRTIEKLQRKEA